MTTPIQQPQQLAINWSAPRPSSTPAITNSAHKPSPRSQRIQLLEQERAEATQRLKILDTWAHHPRQVQAPPWSTKDQREWALVQVDLERWREESQQHTAQLKRERAKPAVLTNQRRVAVGPEDFWGHRNSRTIGEINAQRRAKTIRCLVQDVQALDERIQRTQGRLQALARTESVSRLLAQAEPVTEGLAEASLLLEAALTQSLKAQSSATSRSGSPPPDFRI